MLPVICPWWPRPIEPRPHERLMIMVHPTDWVTLTLARVLANSMVPGHWNKRNTRRALDLLLKRGYSFRDCWQLATGFYPLPLSLTEFETMVN